MLSNLPSAKVSVGFLLASAMVAFVLIFNQYINPTNPIGGELGSMLATLAYGIGAYFTPPSKADVSKEV